MMGLFSVGDIYTTSTAHTRTPLIPRVSLWCTGTTKAAATATTTETAAEATASEEASDRHTRLEALVLQEPIRSKVL